MEIQIKERLNLTYLDINVNFAKNLMHNTAQ